MKERDFEIRSQITCNVQYVYCNSKDWENVRCLLCFECSVPEITLSAAIFQPFSSKSVPTRTVLYL